MNLNRTAPAILLVLVQLVSAAPVRAQGSVLIMGGGSDRKSWASAPFEWFVQRADSGVIINIDVDEVAESYAATFIGFGADPSSTSMRIATRSEANDSTIASLLAAADGIWIEGGDQYDYVSTWDGTLVEEAIMQVFQRGGVVGGTSAGCAVMGAVDFDARYGSSYPEDAAYNAYHGDIHLSDTFLPLIPDVITDSHFHSRGRMGRLVPMLARRIQDNGESGLAGVGVADNTALCIEADLTATCFGEGTVTILYATDSSSVSCIPGEPVSCTRIGFDQLIHGTRYDLAARRLLTPGPGLAAVTGSAGAVQYRALTLDGSDAASADSGEVVITGLTGDELNAWYGNLGETAGGGDLPHTVIIPRLWQDSDYFENRWIGGMYGVARHPGFSAIYLDAGFSLTVESGGRITAHGPVYVLETATMTHAGFAAGRQSCYPGIIGGLLHFLREGDTLTLGGEMSAVVGEGSEAAAAPVTLFAAYPNPFNARTVISYRLAVPGRTRVDIVNLRGAHVATLADGYQSSGYHQLSWEPADRASGIYFFHVRSGGHRVVRSCLYLK
ncbi:Type 1 glutamine amidotransferase-like domain-containing protein [bacterium]|nr:Type 1 glutamine amidotransferase-like domain-containing protein [bacterium]